MSEVDINDRKQVEQKINEEEVSIYAYDKSLIDDLSYRLKRSDGSDMINHTIQFNDPQDSLMIQGILNKDTVELPFISLQRVGWQLNLDRQMYQTFVGDMIFETPDKKEVRAQVIPITINWRMSIYTRDIITADAIIRELLFYYNLRPTLYVRIPHGLNILHTFNIYFNDEIENNSDIINFKNSGTMYRHDLTFYSNDCYLWKANYRDKVAIYPSFTFHSDINGNNISWKVISSTNFDKEG